MRGIESYKNGIIFHGLGNFILQHETMPWIPEEQYNKEGFCRQTATGVGATLNARNLNGKRGLIADKDAWISIVASVKVTETKICATIYPIQIEKGRSGGLPHLSYDKSILMSLKSMSLEGDTNFTILPDNKAKVEVNRI